MSTTLSSYKELIPADRHGANGGVVRKPQFFNPQHRKPSAGVTTTSAEGFPRIAACTGKDPQIINY